MVRLLIVDDNAAFAENLAEILGDFGNQVAIADSGERALELAKRDRFDVLISDMRMPKMGGLELVREMRRIDVGLPAVVVTAYSADQEEAASRAGIMEVLPKPVPIPKLLEIVGRARRNGVVAIVDEDQALVDQLGERLRENGFAPVAAQTAGELPPLGNLPLFAALVGVPPDGEAARELAALFPAVPLLVITKPLDWDQLLETLEQMHASASTPS